VGLNNHSAEGQTQPAAAAHLFAGCKFLEKAILDRSGDAGAGILHSNKEMIFVVAVNSGRYQHLTA
jgi:hypothetical protein